MVPSNRCGEKPLSSRARLGVELCGSGGNMTVVRIEAAKIPGGITMCLDNSDTYLEDATFLLDRDSLLHSLVLLEFACEEMAKAYILWDSWQAQKGCEVIEVDERAFRNHPFKVRRFEQVLGEDALLLHSSALGKARIPFMLGGPDVSMSHNLRLEGAFVDFREGAFVIGENASLAHPIDVGGLICLVKEKNGELKRLVSGGKTT